MSEQPRNDRIERQELNAIRRHAGLPVVSDGETWSACFGPSTTVVVTQSGAIRGCENSAQDLASGGPPSDCWNNSAFVNLRKALADGTLPSDHCIGCLRWLKGELTVNAPFVRDIPLATDSATQGPTRVVLRLPLDDIAAGNVTEDLDKLLQEAKEVVIDATSDKDFSSPFVAKLIEKVESLSAVPKLVVRLRGDNISAVQTAFSQSTVLRYEHTYCDIEAIDVVATLAKAAAAECLIRFVFNHENWFTYEEVAKTCTKVGASLDLRLLDHDGKVPLDSVAAAELTLLRDVVVSSGSRTTGDDAPSSLSQRVLEQVAHELRHIIRGRAQQELAAEDELPATPLQLPPPSHAWCHNVGSKNAELVNWWHQHLFGRAHLPSVGRWLLNCVDNQRELLETEQGTWLRTLVQRFANDQHSPQLLTLLGEIYGDGKQRKLLISYDEAFAEEFDLQPYGGPWSNSLGLLHERTRTRPFDIKEASEPSSDTPDITVLIPSYRHETFIEETLRSVLAQHYTNFKILVVDDRSPDDTIAVAQSVADKRIAVSLNATNIGLGNSVLQALELVETPYVALLNSDDLFHPDRLGKCREVLEQDANVNLVTTGIELVDQDGGQLTTANASLVLDGKQVHDWVKWFARVTPEKELAQEDLFAALLERNFLATSSNLVARTDWLRSQADGLRSLKFCLDWQLFLEAALEGSLHHIHEPLIAYRLHANNTVWFREGRRWSYYLEVNRVAAEALQRFMANNRLAPIQKIEQAVDSVARHLATNTEMDGLALFLNCAIDALQLDEAAANHENVRKLIESLNLRAEEQREALGQVSEAPSITEQRRQTLKLLLGTLANEQANLERDQKHWLQGYSEALETRLRLSQQHRDQLEEDKHALYEDQKLRIKNAAENDLKTHEAFERAEKLRHERELLQDRFDDVSSRLKDNKENLEKKIEELTNLYERNNSLRERNHLLDEKSTRQKEELADKQAALSEARNGIAQEREAVKKTKQELSREQGLHKKTEEALTKSNAEVAVLHAIQDKLEDNRNRLLHEVAQLKGEIDRLLNTREYRTGNFIWNKTPLGYISRRGKKWYRRLLDARDRIKMFFKRKRKPEGTAVVAACWQWPIYSHTFVYQEMISLKETGLDVQMFHWNLEDTDQLHAAFQSLYENRTQLQPIWESHKKDMAHFENTKPGKLDSFLERIAELSGKSVEELRKEPIVMQGCTFARMAELAKARYIHSYFFYDQSFMAMQAAWLLDLPRGVSCYADHMMDDYPWKFVPLHMELCDVVVATSARIKQELSGLSGGKYDDKIIVKPNGVDGDRFTAKTRSDRSNNEPFEVLSVSRIEPKKGLTHLVEAITLLNKRGHKVIAHIIGAKDENSQGSLEYSAEFEACIKEHGLEDQVILHGMMKQEDMPPIIDKCRAFVAPYVETESGDKDGIPTAMLEALASSLPVITTNSGSIVEVIDHEVEGFVVAQRDSLAFANALEFVIKDTELERRMSKAARARFDKDFDIRVTEKRLHARIADSLKAKADS
jgi:colanic acid/amylovoran biosynthesis glycosyltransferase